MVAHQERERVHAETIVQWQRWLQDNHQTSNGVWLVSWRSPTGRPSIGYVESVIEALAFGWVDSLKVTIDNDRSMQWFAPRKPKSGWARPNKERIALLEREGRLRPAGRLAVQVAKDNGAWTSLEDIDNMVVPGDLADAFNQHPGAREHWDAFPPSARKLILGWIMQARTAATRTKRVTETAERAAVGERAHQRPRR